MMRPNLFLLDDDMRRLAPAHPRILDGNPRVWPVRLMLGRATAVMSSNIRYMDGHGRTLWNLRQTVGGPWANLVDRQSRWFEECHGRRPVPGELHDLEGRHAEVWVLSGFQVMDILGMVSMAATEDAEVPVVPGDPRLSLVNLLPVLAHHVWSTRQGTPSVERSIGRIPDVLPLWVPLRCGTVPLQGVLREHVIRDPAIPRAVEIAPCQFHENPLAFAPYFREEVEGFVADMRANRVGWKPAAYQAPHPGWRMRARVNITIGWDVRRGL